MKSLPRPTLLPGLRPLWRDRHTIQLGTDPAQSVVLELPHPAAGDLLKLLDGAHTERAILDEMGRIGMQPDHVRSVLDALVEAGMVVAAHSLMPAALPAKRRAEIAAEAAALALRHRETPGSPAAVLSRRDASQVLISGTGKLADLISTVLIDSGIGTIGRVASPGDAARLVSPEPEPPRRGRPRSLRTTDATFVVQVGHLARIRGTRRRVPHLAVGVRDAVAIVGPLVPESGGPCLSCLDLHRTQRDPAWPKIARQLSTPDLPPCSASTLMTAAGFAAAEVLAHLDGADPSTLGTTVEISGVSPWRRRIWTPHPHCDCTRRAR